MAGHARAAASSAERWIKCSGSVLAAETLIGEDSEAANEGTHAHAVAEHCLRNNVEPWELLGTKHAGRVINQECSEGVQLYVDYVRERATDELVIETMLKADEFQDDDGDTVDAYIVGEAYLHLFDFKYGIGIQKDAKDNPQLLKYAARLLAKIDKERLPVVGKTMIQNVGMTIVQPRGFHQDGPIREHWMTADEVRRWGRNVLKPAMARLEPGQPVQFNAGKHCQFCVVGSNLKCPLTLAIFERIAGLSKEEADLAKGDRLALLKEQSGVAKQVMRWVDSAVMRSLEEGDKVPGFKLVLQKTDRVWRDEAIIELVEKFGQQALTDPTLKSPAQIDKLPEGKSFTSRLAYKPKAGYTVAAEEDNRPGERVQSMSETFAGCR